MLLTGEAGQGKTHLLCDLSKRAVAVKRPTILLLAGRLSGRNFWSEVAELLGLGKDVGSEVLIGGMQAAAEAANAPFLLLLDALNETEKPRTWQRELPNLIAEINWHPWISLGFSVRSIYMHEVLPEDMPSDIAEVEHPGFRGCELDATTFFFKEFGLAQPPTSLLKTGIYEPTVLKLYCECLQETTTPPVGEEAPKRRLQPVLEN